MMLNDRGLGVRLQGGIDGQGGNEGVEEEARDAAEHNSDSGSSNRNIDNSGNNCGENRNGGEPTATYTYQDFAQEADNNDDYNDDDNTDVTTGNKQSPHQKLPKKLAAMLCDPNLVSCITWMSHGRSWKILNRDLFSRYALPKYFGHMNHASFVRIVNAW